MAITIQYPYEMSTGGLQSFTGSATDWGWSQTIIDSTDFDPAPDLYFEILAKNIDSVDKDVLLRNKTDGTTIATITVPTGTTTSKRFRTAAATSLTAGTKTYEVQIPATTTDADVIVTSARMIFEQTNATKVRIQRQLHHGFAAGGNSSTNNFLFRTNSTVTWAGQGAPGQMFWTRDDSDHTGTTVSYELEVVQRNSDLSTPGQGRWRFFNIDQAAAVHTTASQIGPATPTAQIVALTGSETNFNDGDSYGFHVILDSGLGFHELSKGNVYILIDGVTAAKVWWTIQRAVSNITASDVNDDQRILFEPTKNDGVSAAGGGIVNLWGDKDSGTSFSGFVRDDGTNDSGTAGSNIAGSELVIDGVNPDPVGESAAFAMTDGNRYIYSLVEAGVTQCDISGALFQYATVTTDTKGQISWMELQTPNQARRRPPPPPQPPPFPPPDPPPTDDPPDNFILRWWLVQALEELANEDEYDFLTVWNDLIAVTSAGKRNYPLPLDFGHNFVTTDHESHVCMISNGNNRFPLVYLPEAEFYSLNLEGESNSTPQNYTIITNPNGVRELLLSPPPDSNSDSNYTIRGLYIPTFQDLVERWGLPAVPNGHVWLSAHIAKQADPAAAHFVMLERASRENIRLTSARSRRVAANPHRFWTNPRRRWTW